MGDRCIPERPQPPPNAAVAQELVARGGDRRHQRSDQHQIAIARKVTLEEIAAHTDFPLQATLAIIRINPFPYMRGTSVSGRESMPSS